MEYPSRVIEDAVMELSRLPGVGKKTALRLAMHLLRKPVSEAENLGNTIIALRRDIRYCGICGNISDDITCRICASPRRDQGLICVVEDCKDVIAIENTHQFHGTYHVLGGVINPLAGVGPSQLNIDRLVERVTAGECRELVFALASNIEGDTTAFYISRKLSPLGVRITSIARGIPVGSELEFTDEITLARSILHRTEFNVATEANTLP
jgi:recombination protein RecR